MARKSPKRRKKIRADSSNSHVQVPRNIEEAIDYLQLNVDLIRQNGLFASVNIINSLSSTIGLNSSTLILLIDIIGSCKFTVAVNIKLIYCLRPEVHVPEDAIISALSWICTRRLSITLQLLLMQWIVATYTFDIIDTTSRLHLLYGVVFCLLQYEELCPQLCHLLFLLTQKEDVTIYHIQKLLSLQSKLGSQPYIIGLLHMYQQFRPDYLSIKPKPLKCFRITNKWQFLKKVDNRIPLSVDLRSPLFKSGKKTVSNFKDLVSVMESSKNVSTVLNSQHRRLLITSDEDVMIKLGLQFMLQIADEWENEEGREKGGELLATMANVSAECQEELVAGEYVARCLTMWDGNRFYPEVLRVIPHLIRDLHTFDDISEVLEALHNIFCTSQVTFKIELIDNLMDLFKNVVVLKYSKEDMQYQEESSSEDLLLQNVLIQLSTYIDKLCIIGIMQHPENESRFIFAAMNFYSLVLQLVELDYLDMLLVPSASVVCSALFSFSACHLSGVCLLLTRYVKAVTKLKEASRTMALTQRGIEMLNSYILDVSNVLWRCQGFMPRPQSLFEFKLPSIVEETVPEPQEVFAVYRHPALFVATKEYLKKVEEADANIEPRNINSNKAVRLDFLQHVAEYNYKGIILFLQTFLKLKNRL